MELPAHFHFCCPIVTHHRQKEIIAQESGLIRDAINNQTATLTTTISDSKDEIMKQNKEHNANQTAQLAESDRQRKREAEEIQAKLASIEQKQREEQAALFAVQVHVIVTALVLLPQ